MPLRFDIRQGDATHLAITATNTNPIMGHDCYISLWPTAEELAELHELTRPWAKTPQKEE